MIPDYASAGITYCQEVQAGIIPACKWVKLATKRHLDDLARQETPAFRYRFDHTAANRACAFVERLPHIKGSLAGTPIKLQPFQCWIISSLFGWLKASTGTRRFRRAYIELPRSSGKSALSSAIMLYMLAADGEGGAECYSAATTRDQANIVFGDAQAMARSPVSRRMMDKLGVSVTTHRILVLGTNSKCHTLSSEANSLEGLNVHFASVDETHAHKTRDAWESIVLGAAKRSQSLILGISTAGFDLTGIGYELHTYVTKVLEGVSPDETQFGCIWTIDQDDDWLDPAAWRKANPNLGISVDTDYFEAQAREAAAVPSKQPGFKTKYLNLWLSNHNAWADLNAWQRCRDQMIAEGLTLADFAGEKCFMGLDLGAKADLAAKVLLFPRDGKFYVFPTFYLPDAAVTDGRNASYKGWAIENRIRTTEGNILDYDLIEQDIRADMATYQVQEVAIDPWESVQLVNKLMTAGANVVEVMQTVGHLSEPTKELDAMARGDKLRFDCPIMMWCASNVVVREDTNANVKPNKVAPGQKIDGVIALILAVARYLVNHGTDHGILIDFV